MPGLIASGQVTKDCYSAGHWNDEKRRKGAKANYVKVEWDRMVLPDLVLARGKLLRGILPRNLANAQSSGRIVPPEIAHRLEAAWAKHMRSNFQVSQEVVRHMSVKEDAARLNDDSLDDLDSSSFRNVGSDSGRRFERVVSGVRRDPRVRRRVLARAENRCQQAGCGESRPYPGFIDVHHILGAGTSDRVWNCVALCPNCHREAHFAPNREKLNRDLLKQARWGKKSPKL